MNQKIVAYLQQNKESYSKELLVEQLKGAGYDDAEINEGVEFVYRSNSSVKIKNKSKFKRVSIGYGIGVLTLIVIAVSVIFYMYGVNKDILKSDKPKHQKMTDGISKEDRKINKGMGEYDIDTRDKDDIVADTNNITNNNKNDNIVINDIHFSLNNKETLVTGGVEYIYLPVERNINQEFIITIPRGILYNSEGKRDFFKGITGGATENTIFGEWADKNNDEFGFYVGLYDEDVNETEYKFLDITNDGAFQSVLAIVTAGNIEQNELEKIITSFREISMVKSVEFKTNNITLKPPEESARKIEFHFDQEDFIFDVSGLFEFGDTHKRYILKSERRKHEKTRYMIVAKLKKAMYDSTDAACVEMKKMIDSSFKITDILFDIKDVCGFATIGVENGKNTYAWHRVEMDGLHGYTYYLAKDIDDELPVEIINKITNEFKSFEY